MKKSIFGAKIRITSTTTTFSSSSNTTGHGMKKLLHHPVYDLIHLISQNSLVITYMSFVSIIKVLLSNFLSPFLFCSSKESLQSSRVHPIPTWPHFFDFFVIHKCMWDSTPKLEITKWTTSEIWWDPTWHLILHQFSTSSKCTWPTSACCPSLSSFHRVFPCFFHPFIRIFIVIQVEKCTFFDALHCSDWKPWRVKKGQGSGDRRWWR